LEGLAFPEAVARVAEMAGMALPEAGPRDEAREKRRAGLQEALEASAAFFEAALQNADGAKARAYLRDRGLSARTQSAFRLGYGPEGRSALKNHLAAKGFDRDVIEASGMVVHGQDIPVSYDRFRDRVMFPIEDSRERIIAFGGRALAKDAPAKYLNSPETDVFSKGRTLYNFARARKAARDAGTLIAVEGYMDVIALAQAGIGHAVAPLGTALTEDQLDMLLRAADEPVLSFDGDAAGLRAAHRAIDLALPRLKPGKSVRFALLPAGQDPDDVVRRGGREAMDALLAQSRPLADLLWSRETKGGVFDTPERRAELEGNLKRLTGLIADETVRRHYAQDMRDRMAAFFGSARPQRNDARNTRNGGGQGAFQGSRTGAAAGRVAMSDSLSRSPLMSTGDGEASLREAALIVAAFHHPALILRDADRFETLSFPPGPAGALKTVVLDALAQGIMPQPEQLLQAASAAGLAGAFQRLETRVRNSGLWPALPGAAPEDAATFFEQAAGLHRRIGVLRNEMREAEAELAIDGTEERFAAFVAMKAELQRLQQAEALIEDFGVLSGRAMAH
jgi:DNA primase